MRFVIAIALLISTSPGASELIELAMNLAGNGELAHHDGPEHACTPTAHHCACHATMSAQVVARSSTTPGVRVVTRLNPLALAPIFGRTSEPPPLRPPIG